MTACEKSTPIEVVLLHLKHKTEEDERFEAAVGMKAWSGE